MELETIIQENQCVVPLLEREDLLPNKIRERYAELPEELKYVTENELKERYKVTLTDERLRVSFWREVQKSMKTGKCITSKRIFSGICSEPYFYTKFLRHDLKLAWMLQPVMPYEAATNALLSMAIGRYEEIINMDITTMKKTCIGTDDDGKPVFDYIKQIDVSKARLLMDTVTKLEDRVKGMAIQKNITVTEKAPQEGQMETMDMKAINEKLESLRKATGEAIATTCEVVDAQE